MFTETQTESSYEKPCLLLFKMDQVKRQMFTEAQNKTNYDKQCLKPLGYPPSDAKSKTKKSLNSIVAKKQKSLIRLDFYMLTYQKKNQGPT